MPVRKEFVMSQALTRLQMHLIDAIQGKKDRGATMVEYGLLVALISIAAISAILLIGPKLLTAFQTVADSLP